MAKKAKKTKEAPKAKRRMAKPSKKPNMQDSYLSLHQAVRRDLDVLTDRFNELVRDLKSKSMLDESKVPAAREPGPMEPETANG